ncbi:hypothetical protein GKZ90_0025745, partial [Flavobacterium sp. MC2016-06]
VSAQAQSIVNALSNDTRNASSVNASDVTISAVNYDPANPLVINTATGEVTLNANTPAGTYTLDYSICDKLNPSNCSTASVTLTVTAPAVIPVIDAVTETTTAINGNIGGTTTALTANDTLNGNPVTVGTSAGEVSFT